MKKKNAERKRYTITLTHHYTKKLNKLVDVGIYLNIGNAIREGLRRVFEKHKADLDKNDRCNEDLPKLNHYKHIVYLLK